MSRYVNFESGDRCRCNHHRPTRNPMGPEFPNSFFTQGYGCNNMGYDDDMSGNIFGNYGNDGYEMGDYNPFEGGGCGGNNYENGYGNPQGYPYANPYGYGSPPRCEGSPLGGFFRGLLGAGLIAGLGIGVAALLKNLFKGKSNPTPPVQEKEVELPKIGEKAEIQTEVTGTKLTNEQPAVKEPPEGTLKAKDKDPKVISAQLNPAEIQIKSKVEVQAIKETAPKSQRQEVRDLRISRREFRRADETDKQAEKAKCIKEQSDVRDLIRAQKENVTSYTQIITQSENIIAYRNNQIIQKGYEIKNKDIAIDKIDQSTPEGVQKARKAREELKEIKAKFTEETLKAENERELAKKAKYNAEEGIKRAENTIKELNEKLATAEKKLDKAEKSDEKAEAKELAK